MTNQAFLQAQQQLAELIAAAKSGAIIPIRLPGQLEAIEALLIQAGQTFEETLAEASRGKASGDAQTVMLENAEFMKTAIHELRTPMTSIRGYSDMLANPGMSGDLNEMQAQLLQVIRTNSKRMEGLLSDMSYINKLRAGILKPVAKMDMFKNIAMLSEKQTRPLAEEINRTLEFDIPQGLPILTIDGDLLALAMTKLIENGLRYSAEGEGRVLVTAHGEESLLHITIEDNGIGMTEEEMAPLGTLFYRSENDAVRAFKGSGLGIPIAFGLFDLLNCKLEIHSEPGVGTRFSISLRGAS